MEMLKGAISLCAKIHDMYGTFTSNKEQCNWLLANVNNIMTVLKVQLDRNAFPQALEGLLVVLHEDLRASVAILENFGCCSDFKRFVFGSKHASLFAKAGDHLYHSYNTFCQALSIHLVLDERDAGLRRWQVFEEAYQRDWKQYEQDLGVALLGLNFAAQLEDHGISSQAAMCCLPFSAVAPSARAAAITTLEEAQGCSWFMRAEELKMEYKEIKKGQPAKEIRLGKSGSFGDVFSAVHCGATLVAVKKLRYPGKAEELASSDVARVSFAAFVAEVSFAFSLNHPNIVRTIGGVVDALEEPPCWIVMERLQRSLAEMPVHADGKLLLNEFEKLDIIIGICSALVYLHSSNRDGSEPTEAHAHCDLKPENIMYQDGMVKLIDFGIARVSIRSTYGSSVKGTLNWMSPEQCGVAARKTYTLCDMFSFGLIVKWLLVGAREDVPFKDSHIEYIREQHVRLLNSSGCLLHPYVEDLSLVPPVFRPLIQFCTATDSGKRWTAPKAMWELHELKLRLTIAEEGQLMSSPNFVHNTALKYRHHQPSLQSLAQETAASWTPLPPAGSISPGAANPSKKPQTLPVSDTSSSKWLSLLEQMRGALKPEAVASIAYHRNVVFAATLCGEFSDADAAGGALADAAHFAAASKTLNVIATSLESPTSAEVLASLLAKVRDAIPYIEAALETAKSDTDYSKAAELQNLK
jgi:serine/threonine protein kinase